jgi:hypothetical protein
MLTSNGSIRAHSGDGDRLFQPKAITHSGDRDHGRSTEQGGP